MANKQAVPAPEPGEELSEDQLRAELAKARGRIAAMESVGKSTRGGLTHPHDIERLFRLNMLPAEDIARFQATGQLPGGEGEADGAARVVKIEAPKDKG